MAIFIKMGLQPLAKAQVEAGTSEIWCRLVIKHPPSATIMLTVMCMKPRPFSKRQGDRLLVRVESVQVRLEAERGGRDIPSRLKDEGTAPLSSKIGDDYHENGVLQKTYC